MITRAALCPSPPLLAAEVTGQASVLPELREACASAVGRLLKDGPDVVVVAGAGTRTEAWDPDSRLDLARYGPGNSARPGFPSGTAGRSVGAGWPGKHSLPLALGLGAMLLDDAGYGGPRVLRAVADDASPEECVRLGASLAAGGTRTALLAVGDGSARRNVKAPGHFDERAEAFDASVERALAIGDMTAIAGLDAGLARELMATGRAAWQVLAGALGSTGPGELAPGEILYADAPFGVAYLVAVLAPSE